jgi:hypothetical protein
MERIPAKADPTIMRAFAPMTDVASSAIFHENTVNLDYSGQPANRLEDARLLLG